MMWIINAVTNIIVFVAIVFIEFALVMTMILMAIEEIIRVKVLDKPQRFHITFRMNDRSWKFL